VAEEPIGQEERHVLAAEDAVEDHGRDAEEERDQLVGRQLHQVVVPRLVAAVHVMLFHQYSKPPKGLIDGVHIAVHPAHEGRLAAPDR
jgi:hypothetical protein